MSVNSTSTPDFTAYYCSVSRVSIFINTGVMALRLILLIPLCTFVLFLGYRRWRQSSVKAVSHSDLFHYHQSTMELLLVIGCVLFVGGFYADRAAFITVAMCFFNISFFGETFFHILTCVDRYLAVVHPVTYLGLRNARWLRIRNIITGCVWLLSFAMTGMHSAVFFHFGIILILCLLTFSIVVISFCSISVLRILVRPGPGKGGAKKERVDQSKQSAFFTITAILCVLWFRFVGLLIMNALDRSPELDRGVVCVVIACLSVINVPSSLVSPLLFLQKAGKLSYCRRG